MNILFISLVFSDRKHKSFYEEQLNEFVKHGHNVYVACSNDKRSIEPDGLVALNGMRVLRIKTGNITGNVNLIEKGISTITIDYYFKKAINKYFKDLSFDLILYPTPPITLVNTIAWAKQHFKARTYLMLKDIFPQNAIDLGMMSKTGFKGILYKYFRKKEKKFYEISDFIGCMSPANVSYLLEFNKEILPSKVEVYPNCLDIPQTEPSFRKDSTELKKRFNIPEDAVIFLYGGSLGRPQGISFLIKCLERIRGNMKAFFLIIGEGAEYGKIKAYMEENKPENSLLFNFLPKHEYQLISDQCDVGMIFLDYRFTIPNFPSRLLNYLASGNPILAVTDPNSDIGKIALENGFGLYSESNDVEAFAKVIDEFLSSNREEMGRKGWEFLKSNYSTGCCYKIIMTHFDN